MKLRHTILGAICARLNANLRIVRAEEAPVKAGDAPGHEFRGNQYTQAEAAESHMGKHDEGDLKHALTLRPGQELRHGDATLSRRSFDYHADEDKVEDPETENTFDLKKGGETVTVHRDQIESHLAGRKSVGNPADAGARAAGERPAKGERPTAAQEAGKASSEANAATSRAVNGASQNLRAAHEHAAFLHGKAAEAHDKAAADVKDDAEHADIKRKAHQDAALLHRKDAEDHTKEAVRHSGSDVEGEKHTHRLYGDAHASVAGEASKAAEAKEKTFLKTGSKNATKNAMKAHEAAALHHGRAAAEYHQAGDWEKFGKHDAIAAFHNGKAIEHADRLAKGESNNAREAGAEPAVRAAHGEATGKPSIMALKDKVTQAIQEDPRFDTDSHGYPEGSEGDRMREPYCCDVLVPDDDGSMCAVIRTDDGRFVCHRFEWDGSRVILAEGDPEETEPTTVWTREAAERDAAVLAAEDKTKELDAPEGARAIRGEPSDYRAGEVHCSESGVALAAGEKWSVDQPVHFQWMPGGVNTINASYAGRPIHLTVDCEPDTAPAVQASYEAWLSRQPKQEPFGCVEHREEEAAVRLPKGVARFEWRDDPEPGVFLTATATALGARNVNGRVHRSWSPSFTTDADYVKCRCAGCAKPVRACDCAEPGIIIFPKGARGSAENPARITGVAFSVGSLTNKPAFKNILPVRAKQAEPQPVDQQHAEQPKSTMKVKYVRARGTIAAGTEADLDPNDPAIQAGDAMSPAIADQIINARNQVRRADEGRIDDAISRAQKRGAVPPKDTAVRAKAIERLDKGADVDLLVELIDGMAGTDLQNLRERTVRAAHDEGLGGAGQLGFPAREIQFQGVGLQEAAKAYIEARDPVTGLIQNGRMKEAHVCASEAALIAKRHLMAIHASGGDFMLREAVKAADYTDPNSQVGTLATGLILMRNLGFLKNKLNWLPFFTTDLKNEPAAFGQPVFTRYITPPGVLTFVPGVGFTSDATTISNAGAGTVQTGIATQTSGTVTKSAPSTTDRSVTLNQLKATEIEFPITTLASTVRNLFAEQKAAQTYSLAEQVNKDCLAAIFAANWTGTVKKMSLGNFALPQMVSIKNRMTLSKIPDVGRFALLHSYYHDGLLVDSNLLTAKAILALINKDASSFEQGEVPSLFGVKPLESQLASYATGTATAPNIDANTGNVDFAGAGVNQVGFAGNMSSMLFVSRAPQDFNQAAQALGIPSTNAVEIVTEPDSGLTVLVFKYVDNGKMSISVRVCLMWGFAQGDPRIGIVLTP